MTSPPDVHWFPLDAIPRVGDNAPKNQTIPDPWMAIHREVRSKIKSRQQKNLRDVYLGNETTPR